MQGYIIVPGKDKFHFLGPFDVSSLPEDREEAGFFWVDRKQSECMELFVGRDFVPERVPPKIKRQLVQAGIPGASEIRSVLTYSFNTVKVFIRAANIVAKLRDEAQESVSAP